MTTEQAPSELTLERALDRAFNLGQAYWQQADSESYSQNKKSDDTRAKFLALKAALVASQAQPAAEPHESNGRMTWWMPIETAPKDGSRIILWWGRHARAGYWLDNSKTSHPWAGWRTPSMEAMPMDSPTHWMPFPPAPKPGLEVQSKAAAQQPAEPRQDSVHSGESSSPPAAA